MISKNSADGFCGYDSFLVVVIKCNLLQPLCQRISCLLQIYFTKIKTKITNVHYKVGCRE